MGTDGTLLHHFWAELQSEACCRPWILRVVAGPALDPVLLPPPLAASAMLSQDPIPGTTGRPFTSWDLLVICS